MNIASANARAAKPFSADQRALSSVERIVEFYEDAGADYEHWSRGLNMHLGFYRWGLNPFDREAMLEQLNLEIADRLCLRHDTEAFLIDLGCGMGAVARSIATNHPGTMIKGVTLVPSQVRITSEQNKQFGLDGRIEVLKADYVNLPFETGTADGVWAVESACYAQGADKADLVKEMARVLRSGGRFAVADCFVTQPEKEFGILMGWCYSSACRNWAVIEMPSLDPFINALNKNGFRDVVVEDISWRAVPSMLHAPFAVLTFLLKKLFAGEALNQQSINNLKASLLAMILGMNRSKIRYCLISGTRC